MTVSNQPLRADYNGNGATTSFSVPWYFQDNSHLKVIHTDAGAVDTTWVLNTDYTLSGAGNESGGTLTATTAPASGASLHIIPNVPATQATSYVDNESMSSETQEAIVDKLTQICRMLLEKVARCYSAAESSSTAPALDDLTALATSVEAAVDSFDQRYLGSKSSDPTLDNNGDALAAGALYFNTGASQMRVYDGSLWQVAYTPSTGSVDSFNGRTGVVLPASGDYAIADITGAATVAGTGAYSDLTGKPSLATVATSGLYSDLTGAPSLGAVATSNNYSDLTGLPTLGTAAALDTGTTANKVVQLNGSAQLPAVSGALLTNLPATGIQAPTSSILPVGWSGYFYNNGAITADGATIGGSSLYPAIDQSSATSTTAQSGTWKNISGASVSSGAYGLFVRTA